MADALSRICSITEQLDFAELAKAQREANEVWVVSNDKSVTLDVMEVEVNGHRLWCDVSTGRARPLVPESLRRKVFALHHDLSHAGPRPTQRAILKSFVWKKLKSDVVEWCRTCHECMTSKVTTHVRATRMQRLSIPFHHHRPFFPWAGGNSVE